MKRNMVTLREANTLAEKQSPQVEHLDSEDAFGFKGAVRIHMEKLLGLFRRHMRGTRSNKENSLERAMSCVQTFIRFTKRPIWLWTKEDLPAFLEHKNETIAGGASTQTQAGYITYLRILQNFLMNDLGLRNEIHQKFGVQLQEWVDPTNSIVIKSKRNKRKKLTHALSDDEFTMLMDEFSAAIELAFQSNSKARYPLARDKVMTLVAYSYALRVSELVNLHLTNFRPDKRYPQFKQFASVDLIGKGDYEGSTHALDPSIAEVMEWYLEFIRPAFQDQDTEDLDLVFYSQQGGPVTDEQFRRRLLEIGQQAGIKKRVTPHMLRRTNATDSMDLLGPVGTQKNIRHKNVATTYDSYYRPDPNDYGRDLSNAIGRVAALRGRKPSENEE